MTALFGNANLPSSTQCETSTKGATGAILKRPMPMPFAGSKRYFNLSRMPPGKQAFVGPRVMATKESSVPFCNRTVWVLPLTKATEAINNATPANAVSQMNFFRKLLIYSGVSVAILPCQAKPRSWSNQGWRFRAS